MRQLSKSKLLSYRQCEKKLWLELHKSELAEETALSLRNIAVGDQVGEIARSVFDPENIGELLKPFEDGFADAVHRTQELLKGDKPIFEATFSIDGGVVMADVLMPTNENQEKGWSMIEIKASTRVKEYHKEDVAIQAFVALNAGLKLQKVSLGHLNKKWVYSEGGKFAGLIKERDLTEVAFGSQESVGAWFTEAHHIAERSEEPDIQVGDQCSKPFDCPFYKYCSSELESVEFPVEILPNRSKSLKSYLRDNEITDIRSIPDDLLNERQLRVKSHTVSGTVFFDSEATSRELSKYASPSYFLDFETINSAIPIWPKSKAYQQIPFQFSLHTVDEAGVQTHEEFLDLSGRDPTLGFTKELIRVCGRRGPIFVYNKAFESARIREMSERYPDYKNDLKELNARLVDLWPLAKKYYYNPSQRGSWSIKMVLAAIAPELAYDNLNGVQDGGMAMDAYAEAIDPAISPERKKELEEQLRAYCKLDTLAMVKVWELFRTTD